jgi:hypothetical protein
MIVSRRGVILPSLIFETWLNSSRAGEARSRPAVHSSWNTDEFAFLYAADVP